MALNRLIWPGKGSAVYIPSTLLRYLAFKLTVDVQQLPALQVRPSLIRHWLQLCRRLPEARPLVQLLLASDTTHIPRKGYTNHATGLISSGCALQHASWPFLAVQPMPCQLT